MARPQWQQVAAPNYAPAIQGQVSAAEMLRNAIGDFGGGLKDFSKAQEEAAKKAVAGTEQELLMRAMGYTDQAALQGAISDRSIMAGLDPTKVSTNVLGTLDKRIGTLQNRAGTAETQRQTLIDNDRTNRDNAAKDAARPWVAAAISQMAGLPPNLQKVMSSLPAADQQSFLTSLSSATQYGRGNEAYDEGRAVDSIVNTAGSVMGPNKEAQAAYIQQQLAANAINPTIAQAALGKIGATAADGGPISAGEATSGASQNYTPETIGKPPANPGDAVVGHGKYGIPPKAVTEGTFGDAYEFGKTLINNTRNAPELGLADTGKGSSAQGAFQITNETLEEYGKKVFGDEWRNTPATLANQEKIAQAIFEANKHGNLKKRWAALPDSTPGAYKDVPWSEMRNLITKGESGTSIGDYEAKNAAASLAQAAAVGNAPDPKLAETAGMGAGSIPQPLSPSEASVAVAGTAREIQQMQQRLSANNLGNIYAASADTKTDKTTALNKAAELYPSMDKNELDKFFTYGQQNGMNPAGVLAAIGIVNSPTAVSNILTLVPWASGNGRKPAEQAFEVLVDQWNSQSSNRVMSAVDSLTTLNERVTKANTEYKAAQEKWEKMQREAETWTALTNTTPYKQAQAQRNRAAEILRNVLGEASAVNKMVNDVTKPAKTPAPIPTAAPVTETSSPVFPWEFPKNGVWVYGKQERNGTSPINLYNRK